MGPKHSVERFAFYSRLLLFCVQVIFNWLFPDHNAEVFNPIIVHRRTFVDKMLETMFEGFRRWDGIYFIHVAEYGYTYENSTVFFPFFPVIVRVLANSLLLPLQLIANYTNVLVTTSFILNTFVFVKCTGILYDLTLLVVGRQDISYKAAQLFCVNPASIFFSAAYSEGCFAMLTFYGMLTLSKGKDSQAAVLFGLSAITRSNGIVNLGFLLYKNIMCFFLEVLNIFRNVSLKRDIVCLILSQLLLSVTKVLKDIFLVTTPFFLYQFYVYWVFCNPVATYTDLPSHILNYGNNQGYHMPHSGLSRWCTKAPYLSYTSIQNSHWNVGFMKYFTFKQIPNFLLAAPIICLSLCAIISYISKVMFPKFQEITRLLQLFFKFKDKSGIVNSEKAQKFATGGFYNQAVFVYIGHLLFLLLISVFYMHVQVATRFLCSSSPVVFWFVASIAANQVKTRSKKKTDQDSKIHTPNKYDVFAVPASRVEMDSSDKYGIYNSGTEHIVLKAIFFYFHFYLFVGTAAFCNFLPWT